MSYHSAAVIDGIVLSSLDSDLMSSVEHSVQEPNGYKLNTEYVTHIMALDFDSSTMIVRETLFTISIGLGLQLKNGI